MNEFNIGDRVVVKRLTKVPGFPCKGMTGVISGSTGWDTIVRVLFDTKFHPLLEKEEWEISTAYLDVIDEEINIDESVFENYLNGCFVYE